MGKSIKALGDTSGAKAQNVEYFGTDLSVEYTGTLIINVSGTAVDVEITKNSGTDWVVLSSALSANTDTVLTTPVRNGDTINFRTTNVSGITLDYFRVDYSQSAI